MRKRRETSTTNDHDHDNDYNNDNCNCNTEPPSEEALYRHYSTPALIAIFALSFVCYLNAIDAELAFDDHKAITDNIDVHTDKTNAWDVLHHDFWGQDITKEDSHKSYRPVTTWSFRLNYYLSGLDSKPFHFTNIVLHAIGSVLVLCYLRKALDGGPSEERTPTLPLLCAIFFVVHPIHTEAVTGVVGRAELLCCIFSLIGVLCYLKAIDDKVGRTASFIVWIPLSGLCFYLAVFSKETGFTTLGIYVVHDVLQQLQRRGSPTKKMLYPILDIQFWARFSSVLFLAYTYFYVRSMVTVHFTLSNYRMLENPIAFLIGTPKVLSTMFLHYKYFELLLYPITLCADWSYNQLPLVFHLSDVRNLLSLSLYVSVLAIGLASLYAVLKRNSLGARRCLLGLSWLILPFLPASNIFFHVGTLIGERLLYIPSIGFCVLLGVFFHQALRISRRQPYTRVVIITLIVLLLGFYFFRTLARNENWKSEETLFEDAYEKCGNSAKVQLNTGILYRRRKQYDSSITCFQKALEIDPSYCENHYQLAMTYMARSINSNSEIDGRVIVKALSSRKLEDVITLLGKGVECIYTKKQSMKLLIGIYLSLFSEKALSLDRQYDLANYLVMLGHWEESVSFFKSVISELVKEKRSANEEEMVKSAFHQLVTVLFSLRRNQDGINTVFAAYQMFPEDTKTVELIIGVLHKMVKDNPHDAAIPFTLGTILARQPHLPKELAIRALEEAITRDPEHRDAIQLLLAIYQQEGVSSTNPSIQHLLDKNTKLRFSTSHSKKTK